jgi:hypothetical protein
MDVKTCKQCGELKPISQYRQYYGGRRGTYKTCKSCERINSREKYLSSKEILTTEENAELAKIHALYECQAKVGLRPPVKQGRRKPLTDDLNDMIKKYAAMSAAVAYETPKAETIVDTAPYELTRWLTETMDKEPDYYLDEVYEELTTTYRPCTGINRSTMMPEYDNTYKDVLDRILERFNEYEDSYYEGAE